MDNERDKRYTWDESSPLELVEEGDGEELDIDALMERANKEKED